MKRGNRYSGSMQFLSFLLRLVLFVVFTLGFVVLYEHGPENYVENAKQEILKLGSEVGLKNPPSKGDSPAN